MKKNIISLLLLALVTSVTFSSCEDMLTGDMDRNIQQNELATDTLYAYWGILRSLQGIAERYVILGECRGDLVEGSAYVQDSIHAILDFSQSSNAKDGTDCYHRITDFYHVINSCNAFLANCNIYKVTGTNQSVMLKEYAQVAAIRAWVYMQLVLTYGRVPYFETPMLSTADMEAFRNAERWVTADDLASSGVVALLEELRSVPVPNYGQYGRTTVVAYASECIFPQNLVLADIYLLAANSGAGKAYYAQAAQHYYDFLNTQKGGPLLANDVYVLVEKSRMTEQYSWYLDSYMKMFYTKKATSASAEVVTVIPSSTNKLWGRVLRDINELFGWTTDIRVSTSARDTVTTASISLSRNFERQLAASEAYKALNLAQKFEAYIGMEGNYKCTELVGAGDARRYVATDDYTDYDKGGQEQVNFVMKQCPYGSFSTIYPIIYRKGNIWLRFAEALNGAGFPGYAFAILRHGLCGNEDWVPTSTSQYNVAARNYVYNGYSFQQADCEWWDDTEIVETDTVFYRDLPALWYHFYQRAVADEDTTMTMDIADYDQFVEVLWKGIYAEEENPEEADFYDALGDYMGTIRSSIHQRVLSYSQVPIESSCVCDYISLDEMEKAQSAPFLNFRTNYLRGSERNNSIQLYTGVTEYTLSNSTNYINPNGPVSIGIHSRGCGQLRYDELPKEEGVEGGTSYNFVNQVNLQLAALGEPALTEEEIYSNDATCRRKVQQAMAGLILDEMALETAFEGSRFYDLLCYSRFVDGGVEKVARKIANRSGSFDGSLYGRLLDQRNWYLPRP